MTSMRACTTFTSSRTGHILLGCLASLLAASCVDEPGAAAPPSYQMVAASPRIGDVGLAFGARTDAGATTDDAATTITYANVDQIELADSGDAALQRLREAVALKHPVFIESDYWDRDKVEAVGRALLGDEQVAKVDSALLFAEWDDSRWVITRGFDPIAARLGVEQQAPDLGETPDTLWTLGGSTTISAMVKFARAAYTDDAISGWTRVWRHNDNIATVWQKNNSTECTLAWRGSASTGDWAGNVANQITAKNMVLYDVIFDRFYHKPVVGDFYHYRYNNAITFIILNTGDCTRINITGHSLGGAMALYTAWNWSYTQDGYAGRFDKIGLLRAFNPARVGNSSFVSDFNDRVTTDWATAMCRNGDAVRLVPAGFTGQCTYSGAQASSTLLYKNHYMQYWTQCSSATSC